MEEAKKAKEAESKKVQEEDSKDTEKQEAELKDSTQQENKDVEMKEAEQEEDGEVSEDEEEEPEEPEDTEEPPKVELTPDEKKKKFRSKSIQDLTPYALSTTFTKFALPDKDEGFDDIEFDWSKRGKCTDYLKSWVLEKKSTTRIEDLKPSEWFNSEWTRWQKTMQAWHSKQNEYRAAVAKKEADKAAKAAKKAAAKAMAERKRAVEEAAKKKAEEEAPAKGEGEEKEDEKKENIEKTEEKTEIRALEANDEKVEDEEEDDDDDDASKVVDFEGVDIFGVEDICDIGDTSPLFKMFGFEDWAMLGIRFELHLLSHAFTKDADDPDRKGVHLDLLSFYYQKYFKKALNLKFYGLDTNTELVNLVEDTIRLRGSIIESRLPELLESFGVFVKITEESRRDRTRLIDLGEESAKLKIQSGLQSSLAPLGNLGKGGCGFVQPIANKGLTQNVSVVPGKSGCGKSGSGGSWGSWGNKGGKNAHTQSFSSRPAPYSFSGKKGGGKSYGKSWSK